MIRFILSLSFLFTLFASAASMAPESFNFSGRLTDSTGAAVVDTGELILQIFDPSGSCLLYEELGAFDTRATSGRFSIDVGSEVSATKRTGVDPRLSMTSIFRNGSTITGVGTAGPCSYNALAGDQRNLKVTITKIGTTSMTEVFASHTIRAVPYAMMAESLQGQTPSNFAQINTSGTKVLTQSNLENIFDNGNYNILTALLAGTSSLYSKPAANGTSVLPNIATPTSPAAGQVWYDGGSGSIKYYDGSAFRTVGTGGTQTDITATGTITGATVTGTTVIGTNGTITNFNTRNIKVFDSDSSNSVTLRTLADVTADYILTLPPDDGTASQVLTTNGSGLLTWATPAATGVSSVTATAPLSSSGGATPDIAILKATGSVDGYLAAADFAIFNGKQASLGFTPVNKGGDTMTGALINNTNSASTALAVTQAGAGDAATFMGGNVGVGTVSPGVKLEVAGTIRVGDGAETCGASYTGGIRYNSSTLQFCNGTAWSTLGLAGAGITALTGDVGATGTGSVTATIANDAVTFSKMANMNTAKIIGRTTAAAGDPEEIGVSSNLSLSALTLDVGSNVPLKNTANAFTDANTVAVATTTKTAMMLKSTDNINTKNILEVQNNAGTIKASIRPDGVPTEPTDLTTKTYVDAKISGDITAIPLSNYVLKNGDTMTGALVNNTNSASTALAVTQAGAGYAAIFMGGNVGIGTTAPTSVLDITTAGGSGAVVQVKNTLGGTYTEFAATGSSGNSGSMGIRGPSAGTVGVIAANDVYLKTSTSNNIVLQTNAGSLKFSTANTERVRIGTTGNVGIGTTNPARLLQVAGPMRMTPSTGPTSPAAGDMYIDSTGNALKFYDGAGWVTAGGGIADLNGLTSSPQSLAIGTTGLLPNWSSSGSTHTLNIPMASDAGVTRGLLNKTDYDNFASKLSPTLANGTIWIGDSFNMATSRSVSGDVTISNTGGSTVSGVGGSTAANVNAATVLANAATSANTVNAIIKRDGSGNFSSNNASLNTLSLNNGGTVTLSAPPATTYSLIMPTSIGAYAQALTSTGGGGTFWQDVLTPVMNKTEISNSGSLMSIDIATTVSPTANLSAGADRTNANFSVIVPAGNAQVIQKVNGLLGNATNAGTGPVSGLTGISGFASQTSSGSVVGTISGVTGGVTLINSTATKAIGISSSVFQGSGTTVTDIIGLNISSGLTTGTLTNRYGIYIEAPGGTPTNDYGIYQAGTQKNYLAGSVGIGTTSPSAALDVNGSILASGGMAVGGASTFKTIYEAAAAPVNSTTAYSIPDTSLTARRLVLNSNTTITLPASSSVPSDTAYTLTIRLKQDATGSRTVAWAGNGTNTIKWDGGGTAPPVATTASYETIYQFTIFGGENIWYGTIVWKEI